MATKRKGQSVPEKHDDSVMETVHDFGEITVPEKWEDVTLGVFEDYMRTVAALEGDEMPDAITIAAVFTGRTREEVGQWPIEFVDNVMARLTFIEEVPAYEARNYIDTADGRYLVNFHDRMNAKEFVDVDTVLKSDMYSYSSLLAILCRRRSGIKHDNLTGQSWDVSEPYTDEFANEYFDGRREWFSKRPVTEVLPLIAFFLVRFELYRTLSLSSLEEYRDAVGRYADSIESSERFTALPLFSRKVWGIRLKRLRKRLARI